eukprot:58485-Alexandrium_andersonii.AAC.1
MALSLSLSLSLEAAAVPHDRLPTDGTPHNAYFANVLALRVASLNPDPVAAIEGLASANRLHAIWVALSR